MNAVSLVGFTRAYIVLAATLAFGFGQRAAVTLLVLLGLSGVFIDITKTLAEAPRPDWERGQVQPLSIWSHEVWAREETPTPPEDDYGFPSGHVSATTTCAVGLAILLKWRGLRWALVAIWIALMALSRMYLGRHFAGDVLGGVAVGLGTVALGLAVLKLGHLARELREHDPWPAERVVAFALASTAGALLLDLPDAGDAGRLLGLTVGVVVLARHDVFGRTVDARARLVLLATSASGFTMAWGLMALLLQATDTSSGSLRLVAAALPNAALLIAPAWLTRVRPGSAERR